MLNLTSYLKTTFILNNTNTDYDYFIDSIEKIVATLFSLNFASTKFCDLCDFEKITKFNTRVIKDMWTINPRNLTLYNINK